MGLVRILHEIAMQTMSDRAFQAGKEGEPPVLSSYPEEQAVLDRSYALGMRAAETKLLHVAAQKSIEKM